MKNRFNPGEITKYIDPELLTLTYIEMPEEAHVDILIYTTFCDVMMDGTTVTGIVCHNKSITSACLREATNTKKFREGMHYHENPQ